MENNETNDNVSDFLTDEADVEDGVDYIKPNIDIKLPAHKRTECREIVREIKSFGVSQRQLLYTIYLLALELEDMKTLRAITKAIGDNRENVKISNLVVPGQEE